MTLPATLARARTAWSPGARRRATPPTSTAPGEVPPLSPRLRLVRASLLTLLVLAASLLLQLVLVSSFQQKAAKERRFDAFRAALAEGTAPIGPADASGRLLALGTPVAYLEIPSIDVTEVVGEGTSASVLFSGPGHRRDTPLPGQLGTSVIFGRRAAYGGPFAALASLEPGDLIRATTGQGTFDFRVLGVRRAGDPVPARAESPTSRLVLATATGAPLVPSGIVRVDAELNGSPVVGPARALRASSLPREEELMAIETGTLWSLAFVLQLLIGLSVLAVWAWYRWGPAPTWIVFLPPLLLAGLAAAGEVAKLLPNLT